MRGVTVLALGIAAVLVLAGAGAAGRPAPVGHYAVTDLGTLGGTYSRAEAINARGQVVGTAALPGGGCCLTDAAFLYARGRLVQIPVARPATATDVDDAGDVIVTDGTSYLYRQGRLVPLVWTGNGDVEAHALNNAGVIVGAANSPSAPGYRHAFVYQRGVFRDIGTLGGDISVATDVNDRGDVVGGAYPEGASVSEPERKHHAFLYRAGRMIDLGTLGGVFSEAYGVNDALQVVGESRIAGNVGNHAFIWQRGRMTDLGTLGGNSSALAINARGEIVGYSDAVHGAWHAFVDVDGVMLDLNDLIPADSGWLLEQATDVNDHGQIVGVGVVHGETHAFLLTPRR